MWRSIRPSALLFAIGIAACSAQLPSERPLGLGPLARRPQPPEPSGAPVTMPGGAQQMQFESDEDEDQTGGDSKAENEKPPVPSETPDAGVTSMSDAGPAPSTPSSTAPTAVLDFTGDYSGKDVITRRAAGIELKPEEDPNAKLSVKKAGDGLNITIVASNTGDPICTVKGEQKGDTVTVTPGQECPPESRILGKLVRGQAKFQGKQLTLDMTFEASGNIEGKQMTATTDYHFEGTRR